MKNVLLGALLVSFLTPAAFAADANKDLEAKKAKMMKEWEKYSKPGAQHKVLEGMAGEYTFTSKMWMAPDTTPEESTGTASMRMIMDGRWLQQDVVGSAMGKPFKGMGLFGYDLVQGKYQSNWIDNMGTGASKGEGTYDKSTKTLKDVGTYSCPQEADKVREYRGEWKMVSKDKMVYSMFSPGDNGTPEYKHMEMTFSRIKQ